MTFNDAAKQLALVLRAENDHLAAGAPDLAARLLPQKQAATAALQAASPAATIDLQLAATLRDLAEENRTRLAGAIEVQGRILEMVARAARLASPPPPRYGARGATRSNIGAMALALRA